MKKLMFGLAIAAVGTAFAVESSNIVGYKSESTVSGNFNMIAVPFTSVGGGNVYLKDFTWTNLVGGEEGSADVDIIDIWDAENNGYASYYYYNVVDEEDWWNTAETGTFDEEFPDGLPAGQAFWVETAAEREGALQITFSGAVESEATVSYTLVTGNFNMLANPYPVSWSFSSETAVEYTNLIGGEEGSADVDIIDIWDAENNGYASYYYYNVVGEEDWWNTAETGTFDEEWPEGLPAGQAFWVETAAERAGALRITFFRPF